LTGKRRQVDVEVLEIFANLMMAREVMSAAELNLTRSEEVLSESLLMLKLGKSSYLDVLVAEANRAQARGNLAGRGVEIPLHQADYRHLPETFGRCFDAVVCLAAIGYMPGEAEFLRAFGSMRSILRDGGLLVLTAVLTDRQWMERPRFVLNANTRDFTRLFVIDYLAHTARYNVLDIFHCEHKEGLEVWSTELTVLLQADQQRLLGEAGFRSVAFYGSPAFDPYDRETSDQLIAVARR
jgi:SAM-dependent methyltransferase